MTTINNTGSVKLKIVAPDLQKERDKCAFDQQELRVMLSGGQEVHDKFQMYVKLMEKHQD
jgi:hypothetical protein